MDKWRITIEAWPHSTGQGADKDQLQAGKRRQHFVVEATDHGDAVKLGEHIAQGMRTNPMVWLCSGTCTVAGTQSVRGGNGARARRP